MRSHAGMAVSRRFRRRVEGGCDHLREGAKARTLACAMTTIGMHYEVKPGKEEEFEQGFLGVLKLLKTLPGHIESHMYEDIESRGSYVILSQWESKEAYGKFLQSPEFAKA